MITTTVSFRVAGGSYEDLLTQAKQRLSEFFNIPFADIQSHMNFDLVVSISGDAAYSAEVTAKKAKERG